MRILVDKDVRVPLRDGVETTADVFRPDVPEPVPALLQRTPYGKDLSSITNLSGDTLRLAQAGYAVVVQDTRGRGGSGGTWTPFRDEEADGVDSVAWVRAQPWCDGRVGLYGMSYIGATSWLGAKGGPEGLAGIAPLLSTADYHDGWIYRGGAFELGFAMLWTLMFLAPSELARRGAPAAEQLGRVIAAADEPEPHFARTPLVDVPHDIAEPAPFYQDWLARPRRDAGWSAVSSLAAMESIRVPALIVAGWHDIFLRGSLQAYTALRTRGGTQEAREGTRLIVGPWAHGVLGGAFFERNLGLAASMDALDVTGKELAFWDARFGRAADAGKRVLLFVTGPNVWREEDDWPLPDAEPTRLYLRSGGGANGDLGDGTLAREAPGDEEPDAYRYDPRDPVPTMGGASYLPGVWLGVNAGPRDQRPIEGRQDVLCYTSEPLDEPLEVTGPVELVVAFSSSAPDTDVVGRLVDVAPSGRSELVTDGILRARYRDSLEQPEPLEPGRAYELRVDLGACAYVFPAGHRLRVHVTSSCFPRFDRNTNTGGTIAEEALADAAVATNRVHHDAGHASYVVLPVVRRPG